MLSCAGSARWAWPGRRGRGCAGRRPGSRRRTAAAPRRGAGAIPGSRRAGRGTDARGPAFLAVADGPHPDVEPFEGAEPALDVGEHRRAFVQMALASRRSMRSWRTSSQSSFRSTLPSLVRSRPNRPIGGALATIDSASNAMNAGPPPRPPQRAARAPAPERPPPARGRRRCPRGADPRGPNAAASRRSAYARPARCPAIRGSTP